MTSRVKIPSDRVVANLDDRGRVTPIEWDVSATERYVVLDINGGMTSAKLPFLPHQARAMIRKLQKAVDAVDPPEAREERLKKATKKPSGPKHRHGKTAKTKSRRIT